MENFFLPGYGYKVLRNSQWILIQIANDICYGIHFGWFRKYVYMHLSITWQYHTRCASGRSLLAMYKPIDPCVHASRLTRSMCKSSPQEEKKENLTKLKSLHFVLELDKIHTDRNACGTSLASLRNLTHAVLTDHFRRSDGRTFRLTEREKINPDNDTVRDGITRRHEQASYNTATCCLYSTAAAARYWVLGIVAVIKYRRPWFTYQQMTHRVTSNWHAWGGGCFL